jgi:hypothetical protein
MNAIYGKRVMHKCNAKKEIFVQSSFTAIPSTAILSKIAITVKISAVYHPLRHAEI